MRASYLAAVSAIAVGMVAAAQPAAAQQPIKIGIVGQMTGPFAVIGEGYRQGIEGYLAKYGSSVGGRKVEVIYRDSAGSNSSIAKRMTEELVVKDQVSLLGGFSLTPDAASSAPAVNEAKIPAFLFNAATPALINMSPYFLRTGQNIAQPAEMGALYARQNGKSRGYTAVADFAPGHVVEGAFVAKFQAEGGQIIGKDRIPLNTVDFAPFAERVANANPDVLEIFIPPGAPAVGYIKALAARGLTQKILIIGQGEAEDNDLHLFDDSVIGYHSIIYLASTIDNPENNELKAFLIKKYGPDAAPSAFTVGAYDGMFFMYKMIENAAGKPIDGDAAVKSVLGVSFNSPRGPITMGPNRDLIQNFYVRRVEKTADGKMKNIVIKTFEQVQPPVVPRG